MNNIPSAVPAVGTVSGTPAAPIPLPIPGPIPIPIPIPIPMQSQHQSALSTPSTLTHTPVPSMPTPIPAVSTYGVRGSPSSIPAPAAALAVPVPATGLPLNMAATYHTMQTPQPAMAASSINAAAAAAVGAAMNYFPHQFLFPAGTVQSPLNAAAAATAAINAAALQQAINRATPFGIMTPYGNSANPMSASHLASSPPHVSPTPATATATAAAARAFPASTATAALASPIASAQRQAMLYQHSQSVTSPTLHVASSLSASDDTSAAAGAATAVAAAAAAAGTKSKAKKRPAESSESVSGDTSLSKKKKKISTDDGAGGANTESGADAGAEPPKKKQRKSTTTAAALGTDPNSIVAGTVAADGEGKKKKPKSKVKQESIADAGTASLENSGSIPPTAHDAETASLLLANSLGANDDLSASAESTATKKKWKSKSAEGSSPLNSAVKAEDHIAADTKGSLDSDDKNAKAASSASSSSSKKKPRAKLESGSAEGSASNKKKVHAKHIDTYMAHPLWLNRPMNPYALFSKAERVKLKSQIAQRETEREQLISEGKLNPNDAVAPVTGTPAPASFTADQTVADMTWPEVQSLHSVGHQNQLISARWKSLPPDIKQPFESEYDAKENEWLKQLQAAVDGGDSMASEVLKEWRKKRKGFDEATGEIIKKPVPVPKVPVGRIPVNDLKRRPKRGLVVDSAYRAQQSASSGGYISTIKRPGSTTYFGGEIPQPRVRKWIDLLPDPRATHTSFKTEAVALIHAATEEFIGWLGQQTLDTAEARQSRNPSIQDLLVTLSSQHRLAFARILLDEKSALCGTRRPSSNHHSSHESQQQHGIAASSVNEPRGRPMPPGMARSSVAPFPAAQASPSWGVEEEDEDSDGSPPPPLHPRIEHTYQTPAAAAAVTAVHAHQAGSNNATTSSLAAGRESEAADVGIDDDGDEGEENEDQNQADEDNEEGEEGQEDDDGDNAADMMDDVEDDAEEADGHSAMEE